MAGINGRGLRKRLTYRDVAGNTLESHAAGWANFEWQAGPVQVLSVGLWGKVQVYASSRSEGERVIRHAASLAGYDLENDPSHEWIVGVHTGGRIGRGGTMRARRLRRGVAVRMRQGSSGPSYYVAEG